MLTLRLAREDEFDSVKKFYYHVIDGMEHAPFHVGWIKDVYPSEKFLRDAIAGEELFIALQGEAMVGALVLNHTTTLGYEKVPWAVEATPEEVGIIHAFAVSPDYQGKGYAKRILVEIEAIAKDAGLKAIRLDALLGHFPAQRLYQSHGFNEMATVEMFYEDTGWTDFKLYELPL